MPIVGVVSDGQHSIRNAVAEALPGVPHQLCQFHYLREAARPVYEADRHAKVRLKKKARGIRPIERQVEGRDDAEAEAIRGYCAAVRSALTDDGRPPLEASGLKLRDRLAEGRRQPGPGRASKGAPEGADEAAGDPGQGPGGDQGGLARGADGVRLGAPGGGDPRATRGGSGRRRGAAPLPRGCSARSPGIAVRSGSLGGAIRHFLKVTRSYWAGLFAMLRHGRAAADEQRPGAALRLVPLPRAAGQRPEGGVAGDGGARVGAVWSRRRRARLRAVEAADLAPSDLAAWRSLRDGPGPTPALRGPGAAASGKPRRLTSGRLRRP